MKAFMFLLLIVASSKACFPIEKDFVFKCPAPNGKGLQNVFEKFPDLGKKVGSKLFDTPCDAVAIVNYWLAEAVLQDYQEETDYKNFTSFLCEKMFVDGEFYVKNCLSAYFVIYAHNPNPNPNEGELPKGGDGEYANCTEFVRRSEIGVGIDKLLEEAVASDPYVQLAMDYFTSPKFEAVKEKALSIPELRAFRKKITEHKIKESDVIYLYTRLALSTWSRKT